MRAKALNTFITTLVAVTAACSDFGSDLELSYAATIFRCGPADGPVTNIVLAHRPIDPAEPSYPYVSVWIEESVSGLAGRSWDIASDSAPAVWYITGPGKAQGATLGRVTVTSVDGANTVDGAVDLLFGTLSVSREFTAPWIPTNTTCP